MINLKLKYRILTEKIQSWQTEKAKKLKIRIIYVSKQDKNENNTLCYTRNPPVTVTKWCLLHFLYKKIFYSDQK